MGLKYRLCAMVLFLAASGCSNNQLLIKKQTEMEARLEQLLQANSGTGARLAEMNKDLVGLQGQVKTNSSDLEQLKSGMQELKAGVEQGLQHAEGKTMTPAPSRIVVVNKEVPSGEGESAEQDVYMKAFGLFSANKYGEAIQAFQSFIASYPGSEYAGNAQYWIGECYYTQRDYSKALKAFYLVIDTYPKGSKVPDAMLKAGYSFISMNQHDKAKPALEALVEKYPKTPAAMKARERLNRY